MELFFWEKNVSWKEEKMADRENLTARQLPEMVLSTAENPLTAPQPPPKELKPEEMAKHRFEVKGNAIGTLAVMLCEPLPAI